MAYDPRQMMQLGQMGLGMLGPQGPQQAQPKQWWEQPMLGRSGGAQSPQSDQPGQPGLLEMLSSGTGPYANMPRETSKALGAMGPLGAVMATPWYIANLAQRNNPTGSGK